MSGSADDPEIKAFTVEESEAGGRLDAWLAGRMPPHVSRNRVAALIRDGMVMFRERPSTAGKKKVAAGETYAVLVPPPEPAAPRPQKITLDILHEDDHLIVVNKPVGMVVHPGIGNPDGTLVNALLHHCGSSLAGIGGVKRPGIVHRLDKDTSGVMVAAKTEEAMAGLAAQFADHGRSGPLERAYLALVWDIPASNAGTVDAPLGRAPNNRTKRAIVEAATPGARHAVTHYKVLETFIRKADDRPLAALLECRLETGRTHQIRVHMAHLGHPLVGDPVYGKHFATKADALPEPAKTVVKAFGRQALHAAVLGFEHPATGKHLRFEAPDPDDFRSLKNALKTI